ERPQRSARKLFGDLSAAGVEGAALFLVDDAVVSSRSEPQRLRSQTPARRARLCDELGSRHALAGRELRRAAGRDVMPGHSSQSCAGLTRASIFFAEVFAKMDGLPGQARQ